MFQVGISGYIYFLLLSVCAGPILRLQWINTHLFELLQLGRMLMEGSRDVSLHLIQADYDSLTLAVVTLQMLTRQSKHLLHDSVTQGSLFSKTSKPSARQQIVCWNHIIAQKQQHLLRKIPIHGDAWKACLDSCQQRHIAQVTVNSSGEEICNLFYSYPKDTAYANEIILAAKWPSASLWSHQLHIKAYCLPKTKNNNTQTLCMLWQIRKEGTQCELQKVGNTNLLGNVVFTYLDIFVD